MRKLTEEEVLVLAEDYNLADGHAYRAWSERESAIIDSVTDIFRRVDRRDQKRIEADYFDAFFTLGEQTLHQDHFQRFLCFTASTGLEVIANHLRLNKMSVALVEPCFDNLTDILKRHQISLTVFPDNVMAGERSLLCDHLRGVTSDAIFLVSPNNPTGTHASKDNFALIIDFCKAKGKLLILDACFRFYLPDCHVYNQYQMLAEADIDCIVVEDTGKTWPTLEIKAPFFCVSRRLIEPIARVYSDFLLHVSPFAVSLLAAFVRLAQNEGFGHVRDIIAENRRVLYENLAGTLLEPVEADFMSVSWLRIASGVNGRELTERLAGNDVHVLPGNRFFWSDPARGDRFIRVSLARDSEMFRRAAARLGHVCRQIAAEEVR